MSCKNFYAVLKVNPQTLAVVPYSVPDDVSEKRPKGLMEDWDVVELEAIQEQIDNTFIEFVTLADAVVYQEHWRTVGDIAPPSLH